MYRYLLYGMVISLLIVCGPAHAEETPVDVAGGWEITITFIAGIGHHTADIKQDGEKLTGDYKGEIKEGTLRGTIKGISIDFTGFLKHEATSLRFHYTGKIENEIMTGDVEMGEFWTATFTAKRKKQMP